MFFGWYIGKNVEMLYNSFVEIYHDGKLLIAGDYYEVIDEIDEYYFHSLVKKVYKKGNVIKIYLSK